MLCSIRVLAVAWLCKARLNAVLGGMRFSLKSLKSGLRCYRGFVGKWLSMLMHTWWGMRLRCRSLLPRHEVAPVLPTITRCTDGLVDAFPLGADPAQLPQLRESWVHHVQCVLQGDPAPCLGTGAAGVELAVFTPRAGVRRAGLREGKAVGGQVSVVPIERAAMDTEVSVLSRAGSCVEGPLPTFVYALSGTCC